MTSKYYDTPVNRVVGAGNDRPSCTYLADWVWLSGAPDHAVRVYLAVRAFVFDKDDTWTVKLTDADLAALTHRSSKAVQRSRRECYKHGLLTELGTVQTSVADPNGGRPTVRTERTLRVEHEPPQGYGGPVNCYRQLRATKSVSPAQCEGADLSSHIEQGKRDSPDSATVEAARPSPAETDVSSAQCGWTDLSDPRTDLSDPRTDLSDHTPIEQGKHAPQVPFTSAFPNQAGSADARGGERPACLPAEPELTPAPTEQTTTPGAELLRGLTLDVAVTEQVVRQQHQAVDALLDTWSEQGLAAHLEAEAGAGRPRSRMAVLVKTIRSTRPKRVTGTQRQRTGLPAPCGQCDATADSPELARRVLEVRDEHGRMRLRKCPQCHPHAENTQKPAQQAHTTTQTGSTNMTPETPKLVIHSGDTARQSGTPSSAGDLA